MSLLKQMVYCILALVAIIYLPYIGAWFRFSGGHFPPDYFDFPAASAPAKSPFDPILFTVVAIFCLFITSVFLFPSWYRFKKVPVDLPRVEKVRLPIWFWIGLVAWAGALALLWLELPLESWFIHWALLPLFWGFTLLLDGWLYVRTGGKSLINNAPQELLGMAVAACSGWMLFEYLNFFVENNWFYPFGNLLSGKTFLLYATVGSSGLMSPIYVLYCLFKTSPALRERFSNGVKVSFSPLVQNLILIAALAGLVACGYSPENLFGVLWLSPLLIITVVLSKCNIWTPFADLRTGNWTNLGLYALTYVVYGICLECWNYFTAVHDLGGNSIHSLNPAHWVYSLPKLSVLHVFEMPLLGYFGYLPFGVYCIVWWKIISFLLNMPSKYIQTGIF